MSQRERLEHEVDLARERVEQAPIDTPQDIKNLWEKEFVELEFELNNFVDEDDNNE